MSVSSPPSNRWPPAFRLNSTIRWGGELSATSSSSCARIALGKASTARSVRLTKQSLPISVLLVCGFVRESRDQVDEQRAAPRSSSRKRRDRDRGDVVVLEPDRDRSGVAEILEKSAVLDE